MRDFNRGRKFGRRDSSRPSYRDSRRSGRDSDRPERRDFKKEVEMHSATCDKCGARCEVPFKPSGSKPVYCSDCFRKDEYSESGERSSSSSAELEQINQKLDKIL